MHECSLDVVIPTRCPVNLYKKTNPPDLTGRISPEYMAAVKALLEQVRMARHDNWQATSCQAALLWNRVVREKILAKEAGNG